MAMILTHATETPERNDRRKLSEQARDWIRDKIVTDVFPFGRVLRESELSEMLNMSKSPIREAVVELAQEGLVVMSPNRSARVITLDAADVSELGYLREVLEVQGVRLAIAKDQAGLVRALDRNTRHAGMMLERDDIAGFSEADHHFHLEFFRHCGNQYLEKSFVTIAARIQSIRTRLTGDPVRLRRSHETHIAVLQAVRAHDADCAGHLLSEHVRSGVKDYAALQAGRQRTNRRRRVQLAEIERFAGAALAAVGADAETVAAVIRALSHASLHGVDSHGYRLLPHYLAGLERGRLNPRPRLSMVHDKGSVAVLDADHAHGARATFAAAESAVARARNHGAGAVAIRNSSHFGAAGAYALAIADSGMAGICVCNSDPFVRLHGGAERFHGTNPIAFAASTGAPHRPWLFDMATSAIPFNKVELSRSLGIDLPTGTASDANGVDTIAPSLAEMLAPLGGAFGYKGAGLAGISEILSTALSDSPLSFEIPPMISDDMETPRRMGAFVLALDPEAFMGREVFEAVIRRYRSAIRASTPGHPDVVMPAGDREWAEADRRRTLGITLDQTTVTALDAFAVRREIPPLATGEETG